MSYNPQSKYIHRDLHSGNVLLDSNFKCLIGDLGLSQPSQPTNKKLDNEIYGVIPYVAPEILSGKLVSQGSDIYSMGMIMWECTTGIKPFTNVEHDHKLIFNIIDGVRPEITEDTPKDFANLMKKCWDSDPSERPSITDIGIRFRNWNTDYQFELAEQKRLKLISLEKLGPEFSEKPHPKAIYTSRPLRSLISKVSSINTTSSESSNTGM
ncbi:11995_t:CDS:2 [Funneliformis geosporum]|nr:11995_t:CDS:2 [Funneliformis geosporum]